MSEPATIRNAAIAVSQTVYDVTYDGISSIVKVIIPVHVRIPVMIIVIRLIHEEMIPDRSPKIIPDRTLSMANSIILLPISPK